MRAVIFLIACTVPAHLAAQIGSTTDILTGTVRRVEGSLPIEGAQIEVLSLESNITRRARTNAQGRYTILFPDGGGQYQVTARALGLAPQTVNVVRTGDEDRLVHDFTLTTNPTVLSAVQVRARQDVPRDRDVPTPGSTERAINTDQAARLPIDASDLMQLALLAPGVVSIPGTDSTASGFSVAGLSPAANNITLDGLSFGASQVPQEAVRNTRVITSNFDVSRGQFSGGLVSSTTRSGSNNRQGNFSYSLRDRDLSLEGEDPSPAAQGFTQNQLSGGFGGPVVRDKLFWFGSMQLRRRSDVVTSLTNSDPLTLTRYGVSPDSVNRFMSLLTANGLSPFAILADDRLSDNVSGLLRLDYLTDGGHSVTVRGDYRWNDQDPSRIGPLALPQTGGNSSSLGGGLMATVTSNFGGRFLNELKVYAAADRNNGDPFITVPAGRIQINSDLGADQSAIASLVFGGNTGLPQEGSIKTFEATNEVSWIANGHRLRLGTLVNVQSFEQDVTTNRWGTFAFNSLADFEAGRPASFTRTLTPRLREGQGTNASLFLGDVWRVNRALQLTYGLRAEGSFFGRTPDYNPAVETRFGYRTDRVPTDVRVSPRIGFTWNPGDGMQGGRPVPPRLTIRGGIGEFRSAPSTGLVAAAAGATGLANNESQLICIGSLVPVPNWQAFVADPSAIPSSCLGGGNQFVPTSRPNVTVFGDDFSSSRAWRATFGASRRFRERFNLGVDLAWSRGVALTGYRDVNLQSTPAFTIAAEAGRPVFVPAATIVPATGASTLLASRQDPNYGQVLVTRSDLASDSRQMTVSFGGFTRRGISFNGSWTLATGRDQGAGGGGGFGGRGGGGGGGGGSFGSATTAGNPNIAEWATSGFQRRHTVSGSLNFPVNLGWEVTMFGRLSSGTPFTPMVGSDINGDGSRNDRAFLFNPATATDVGVSEGMSRLLDNAPEGVRSCLTSQFGGIARRNSCVGPWEPSLDLQVNWRPNFWGLNRRLAVSILTVNAIGGLDELLHGSGNLRGWGQFRGSDNTLLYVRGFDPATNNFRYEVNERFGASRNGANAIRVPFQIGVQARYTVGPDRMRQMITGMLRGGAPGGGGRGADGGGGGGPGGRGANAAGGGPLLGGLNLNPAAAVIQMRDSLRLTTEQVARLQPLADSIAKRNGELGAEVRKLIADAGANSDMGAVMTKVQPRLQAVQTENEALLKAIEGILTAEQWARVPPRIRNAGRLGVGGRR
ncbi:MAG: carboxypeptidase regulatory-like domain-containing protein [Gemmatimonadota bacterium]